MAKVKVIARLSYPNIFEAGKDSKNAKGETIKGKHGAQLIMPKKGESHLAAQAVVYAQAEAAWGVNWQTIVKNMEKSKICLRRGETQLDKTGKIRDGYGPDVVFISARNPVQPRVVAKGFIDQKPVDLDKFGNCYQNGKLIEGQKRKLPYAGCYVTAVLDISAGDIPGVGKSIWAKLLSVQFYDDGAPFSATATDDDIADEGDDGTQGDGHDPLDDDMDTPTATATATAAKPAAKPGKVIDPLADDDDEDELP